VALRVADYRGALDLIGDAQGCRDAAEFRSVVSERLYRLIGADMANVGECHGGSLGVYDDYPRNTLTASAAEAFRTFGYQHPGIVASWNGLHDAIRVSDFLSMREWRRLDVYQECHRHIGGEHEIGMTVVIAPDSRAGFSLERSTSDFTERERELLDTLRPHLGWCYRAIGERTDAPGPSAELLGDLLPVSPREAEVLACVACGNTNAEVAQELFISHHTVNKHLERIYEKLGVPNRTAASAAAHRAINGAEAP
jgi:DNA-binding CsgD family transcriptional regulator